MADVEWEDIRIERIVTDEVTTPRGSGPGGALYAVPFVLSRSAPGPWSTFVVQAWDRPESWTSMHRPGIMRAGGDRITLDGTTIEEVEAHHKPVLRAAVAKANLMMRRLLEERATAQEEGEARRDQHRRRVEEAAKRVCFDDEAP